MATIEKIIKEFKKLERGKLSKEVSGYVPYEQAERFLIHYLTQIHTQAKEDENKRAIKILADMQLERSFFYNYRTAIQTLVEAVERIYSTNKK